jgi:hypothetical protein
LLAPLVAAPVSGWCREAHHGSDPVHSLDTISTVMVRRLGACGLSALLCCFVLVDAAHGQVFVTGGHGYNEIAVVHLDGSGVTMIPNAPGATELTMAEDGSHVYANLFSGDGIAEIDTETLALRRISTGAGYCPSAVAAVAGYVWFVATSNTGGCSQTRKIRRLDPMTGTVSPDVEYPYLNSSPVLREVPGTTRLVYIERSGDAEVLDVADGSFTSLVEGEVNGSSIGPSTQLTTNGSLRLYQVDNPAAPSPQLSLEVPSETPAGEPLTVSGALSYQGSPIAGATVTVREEGVEQPLGSPTTDADGRYSLEVVPHSPERMYLTAMYAGGASTKPAVAREVVGVVRRPVTLTLMMPDSVWRDEVIPISGTLLPRAMPWPVLSWHSAAPTGSGAPKPC